MTMYEKDIRIHIVVMSQEAGKVTTITIFSANIVKTCSVFLPEKNVILVGNTFINCSRISVVHVNI